ncbi:BREX-4 system phosphatase PglZ [Candidatus Magnetominusculus xianensis]|uniref:BREX-4 system phosphatase PglZ n=1 Tax=Candidatus Magnetominusculus xianensis TaxID=1748249 RepID=A0ABR5SCN4_9BACT|nr:BREX-4 system phosphatase PglZ [Candidatus Magnetominusculus xianensis]KWT75635.1 hypothetical protein ASN18_3235 [Candidatus Magnetominusculus xianensis]MBF0403718.1 BREX-4 system phosphatase PglZ [Nitrospirota bacterium]
MNFATLDELKGHVVSDLELTVPICFINVESLNMWITVKSWLTDICQKSLRLSDFCAENDLTPNINRMINELRKTRVRTLLIPLSEYLRINNDKTNDILSRIINLGFNNEQIAIFIPLYRMKNVLSEFIKRDIRYEKNILFLETTEDDDYSLIILPSDLNNVDLTGYNITGIKRYYSYWEENPDKPIVLRVSDILFYKDIISADKVTVLITAFDVLKYHCNINAISESMGTNLHWSELLNRMNSDRTLGGVFARIFNIPGYNAKYLFEKWGGCTEFEKWAIWLWSKLESADGYLRMALDTQGCDTYRDNIRDNIIELICKIDFKHNQYDGFYRERKEYLKCLSIETLTQSFWDEINKKKPTQRLHYLTDYTSKERCEILRTIESEGLTEKIMCLLETADPVLRAYIEPYVFKSEKFTEYFGQYKRQKITNTVNTEFIDKVSEYASKGLWWELSSRNKLFDDAYGKGNGTLIFWIDALGVEYLSLIVYLLREHHHGVYYKIEIGYANIPTITELNNDFLQGRNPIKFRELDELKHKGEYPEYIVQEFTLIEKALRQAVEKLSEYEKVIITADHGASRLAVIAQAHAHKAKEGAAVKRHGRYCEDSSNNYEGEIAGCVDKDKYHVFAGYDRFSIQGNITGEIHGGATLEEVLVPVIELSKRPFDAAVTITVVTPEIRLRAGQKAVVKFQIDRDFDKLYAEVQSKRYDCARDIDCWYFEPDVDRKIDNYKAKILHEGRLLGSIQYKIQKGITSTLDI